MNRITFLIVENNHEDRITEIRPSNGMRCRVREEDFMASHLGKSYGCHLCYDIGNLNQG